MTAPFAQPPEWMADALCAQVDVGDLFFPEKGEANRQAKAVCNGDDSREPCPVRETCLRYALDNEEKFGIWGGLSERERWAIRPRVKRPHGPQPIKHGTASGAAAHRRRGEKSCGECVIGDRLKIKVGAA